MEQISIIEKEEIGRYLSSDHSLLVVLELEFIFLMLVIYHWRVTQRQNDLCT